MLLPRILTYTYSSHHYHQCEGNFVYFKFVQPVQNVLCHMGRKFRFNVIDKHLFQGGVKTLQVRRRLMLIRLTRTWVPLGAWYYEKKKEKEKAGQPHSFKLSFLPFIVVARTPLQLFIFPPFFAVFVLPF